MDGAVLAIGLLAVIAVLLAVVWFVSRALHNVHLELRGVNERVTGMEQNQVRVDQGVAN